MAQPVTPVNRIEDLHLPSGQRVWLVPNAAILSHVQAVFFGVMNSAPRVRGEGKVARNPLVSLAITIGRMKPMEFTLEAFAQQVVGTYSNRHTCFVAVRLELTGTSIVCWLKERRC